MNILTDWQQVKTRHGDKRPLNDDQRRVIDFNRCKWVKVIDPSNGIVDRLYDNKCFNAQHKDHIECGVNNSDKAERLLDIMRRRNVADFNRLADELRRWAQILKKGGGKY